MFALYYHMQYLMSMIKPTQLTTLLHTTTTTTTTKHNYSDIMGALSGKGVSQGKRLRMSKRNIISFTGITHKTYPLTDRQTERHTDGGSLRVI